jgi:Flp pilus assembly protein TadG
MKSDRTRTNERGSALVEAALTMLGFLVIIFAIFETGRMMSIQQTITNAAREGARLSVLPAAATGGVYTDTLPSTTAVQDRVQTFLNASGLNGAAATVNVNQAYQPDGAGTPFYALVTVTVPYRVVSISMFSLLEVNLRGQAKMRNETNLE